MAFRLVGAALLALHLSGATPNPVFEIRGEVLPHLVASVSLHAIASPFAVSTLAGLDGHFRFKDLEPGTYTLSVATQLGSEVRKTIEIGAATADNRGRVRLRVSLDGDAYSPGGAAKVSVRTLQISDRAEREYERALSKIARRDFEGAVACLHRSVDIAPNFSTAWNQLGTMAYQTQHYREAENYFRKGIETDPNAYEPLVNLGGVLLNLQNFDEALKYNTEAVRRRPEDALARSQLGMTYALLNQFGAAEKHLLISIRLDPDHFSRPQLTLADVYIRKNEPGRAADQLESFLRTHPDWPTAAKMEQSIGEWRSRSRQIPDAGAAEQRK
jgi:tetratricopeptide (TPR) repeat protein